MNDDLEPRLRDAFHRGSLPSAPASLVETLERVPEASVRARGRSARAGRASVGLLAAAIVLIAAGAVAVSGGPTQRPARSASVTAAPTDTVASPMTGPRLYIEYRVGPVAGVEPKAPDMARIAAILRSRIATTGVVGSTVDITGTEIVIELPGVTADDTAQILPFLGRPGRVDFVGFGDQPAGEGALVDLTATPPMFGNEGLESVSFGGGPSGEPVMDITLTPAASATFARYTREHIGSYFGVVLDGVALVVPAIQSEITDGRLQITFPTGRPMDQTQRSTLIGLIRSGPLPFPLEKMVSEVIVGPASTGP